MYTAVTREAQPTGRVPPALATLSTDERAVDARAIALPRAEVQIVARFGAAAPGDLDVHAMGARTRAHRKLLRGGQRVVSARLGVGAVEATLGVSAAAMTGRIVALEDLWGAAAARRLVERLRETRGVHEAAVVLEGAIAERARATDLFGARNRLVLAAADRLAHTSVSVVADDLGISERHLRRLFQDTLGVGPKTFAKLARFRAALRAARGARPPSWAQIAMTAGYYDQAHLIAEFRGITGVTPRALLDELRSSHALG